MIVELFNVTLIVQQGFTGGISTYPHECPACERMTFFWENRNGVTRCTGCPGPQRRNVQ